MHRVSQFSGDGCAEGEVELRTLRSSPGRLAEAVDDKEETKGEQDSADGEHVRCEPIREEDVRDSTTLRPQIFSQSRQWAPPTVQTQA